jgi:hypothetical protein
MGLPWIVAYWEYVPFTILGLPLTTTLPLMVASWIQAFPVMLTLPERLEYPNTTAFGPT